MSLVCFRSYVEARFTMNARGKVTPHLELGVQLRWMLMENIFEEIGVLVDQTVQFLQDQVSSA